VAPPGSTIPWASPYHATISIDEIDVFHNGAFLDASNTAWSVSATCSVNGAVVAPGETVWTQSSVSAGGSHVGNEEPWDPNSTNATSTYGRYSGLPWSRSFPIASGNTLRCNVGGQRTDPSTPVTLPNIPIEIPVDVDYPDDGWHGNYDTGNRLDYVVHYTVTYSQN
jgi:hypothetical protein